MLPSKQHSRGAFPCSSSTIAGACIVPNGPAYRHARTPHPCRSISSARSQPNQLQYRLYGQSFLTKSATAVQSCRHATRSRSTAVAPRAYLHSDASDSSSSGQSVPGQLRVLVVGANPVGLAAAVALAQQAGCAVEVHDSRGGPREDQHADNNSTLVALGKRGLDALSDINLPPPSSGGRAVATITTGSSPTPSSTATNSTSTSPSGTAGLWGPGSGNLGVPPTPVSSGTASSTSGNAGAKAAGQGLSEMTELSPEPLPGLTLLQGMVVMGAGAARREEYSRLASRSKPKSEGATVTGGMTAGVAAVDELTLTARLLAAAAALASTTASASQSSLQPQLVLPGAQTASASGAAGALNSKLTNNLGQGSSQNLSGPVLSPKGTTAVPQGPTLAPSAEAAQAAALPPVVPTPGTGSKPTTTAMGVDLTASGGLSSGAEEAGNCGVEVHFDSHLTLFDAANKQATFMGPGGAATIVPYDLCIAADASGGGHLVMSALKGLHDRQEAHKHPSAAHHSSSSSSSAGVTGVSELEYRAWHDMPQDPGLAAMLGAGASKTSSTGPGVSSTTPQQGWLLVWTGPGNVQAAHPGLSSAGSNTSIIPGAPTCTVMAWPSKGGATWSGCVFTHPQVFEALRSQSDYEQFLGSVSAPAGRNGNMAKLPALWVQGIAAQLKRNDGVGSVPAAVTPPPHSLCAPSAGLVALSTAAVPSNSPQLLNPGISLGLAEASSLAAALSAQLQDGAAGTTAGNLAGADGVAQRAEGLRKAVQEGLKQFDAQHGPEAQALHKLTAQLSWLRHPFSPAAAAAAASVPFGTLAWIFTALGAPRTGLALQWKCLLAVLPIVAAVQRVLLYKLGLGRPDTVAAARSSRGGLDASYRKPAAVGASTSLDSGVHVAESAQAQKESAALSVLTGFNSQAPGSNKQGSANLAYSLSGVADAVEPCGKSFLSFLHTTDMPPTGIWRLLQVAPLIVSVLWGALFWAAAQAVKWGMWAFRAWGWAQSGVA